MTFCRAYISGENPCTYAFMFKHVFRIVAKLCQRLITWRHLSQDGTGFGALIMDMDSKQLTGNVFLIYC